MKLAAKYEQNQSKVWSEVAKAQEGLSFSLSDKTGHDVKVNDSVSASSFELALENEELKKAKHNILKTLQAIKDTAQRLVGYAYSINGKLYGLDIYNNRQLIYNLWNKLMDAIVVESIGVQTDPQMTSLSRKAVIESLKILTQQYDADINKINSETEMYTYRKEGSPNILFTTIDRKKSSWIHYNLIDAGDYKAEMDIPVLQQHRN